MFPLQFLLIFLSTIFRRIKIFVFSLIMSENLKNHDEQEEPLSTEQDPDPFNPVSPSTPISYPIKTLEELESRSYFESFHYPFNCASVSLQTRHGDLPDRPRILVCHDMEGGYVDDKWVQGGDNPDAYAIWHWYLMDVFVYFSHNLVTLPPPCWTNAAHRHGVRVIILRSFADFENMVLIFFFDGLNFLSGGVPKKFILCVAFRGWDCDEVEKSCLFQCQ